MTPKEPPTCCPRCKSDHPGMRYFVEPRTDGGKEPCRHPFHTEADADGKHPEEPSLGEILESFVSLDCPCDPDPCAAGCIVVETFRDTLVARLQDIMQAMPAFVDDKPSEAAIKLRALATEIRGRG